MAVDLHLHSVFSDGTATPEEIVAAAADVGLSGIALTDHDTLDGIPRATAAATTPTCATWAARYSPRQGHAIR